MVSICFSWASVRYPVRTRNGFSGSHAFRRRSRVDTIFPVSKKTTATSSPAVSLSTPDFCWTAISWRISGRLKSSRFPWSAMSGSPARPRPRGSRAPALVLVGGGGQVLDVCRRGGEISSDGDRVGEQEEEHERNSLGQSRRRDGEHVERGNEGAVPDDEDGRRAHDEERQEAREGSAPQHLRRAG